MMDSTGIGESQQPHVSSVTMDEHGKRQGHLLSLLTMTTTATDEDTGLEVRQVDPRFLHFSVSAYLAWRDLQEGKSRILPHLEQQLCDDFQWSLESRDDQFSRSAAIQELMATTKSIWQVQSTKNTSARNSEERVSKLPTAMATSLFSSLALQVNYVASALEIPQISATATSMDLDGRSLFARTIPTNAADARAVITYYHSLGITRVASVFIKDDYGIGYNDVLSQEAQRVGIKLIFFPVERDSVAASMKALKESKVKYVFAIGVDEDIVLIFNAAVEAQVLGQPDYAWMVPDINFALDAEAGVFQTQANLAKAIHGMAMLNLKMTTRQPAQIFDQVLTEFLNNETQQAAFLDTIVTDSLETKQDLFSNYSFPTTHEAFVYHYLQYDSVIALGLAACQTPGLFTGQELHDQLLQTSFDGITGSISFNNHTGTRSTDSIAYQIENILLKPTNDTQTSGHHRLANESMARFEFDIRHTATIRGDNVQIERPFVYFSGDTVAPPVFPPMDPPHDYHLKPLGVQIFGWILGSLLVVLSLGLIGWTLTHRNKFIVRVAQPVFLCKLCCGTLLMALAIFPLSMQDSPNANSYDEHVSSNKSQLSLDIACMSIPWLLFLGFITCVSSLLSKTWRLNQIMSGGQQLRRIVVTPKDVMLPFFLMLFWNVALLLGWTLVSPYQYVRTTKDNYDEFGRSLESYGACQCPNNWVWLFASLLCLGNFIGVMSVVKQCYHARNLSSYFSETSSLGLSMASLIETALLGGPFIFMVKDEPSAFFVVASILICIVCMCFIVPIFGFKYLNKERQYADAKRDARKWESMDRHNFVVETSVALDKDSSTPGHMKLRRVDSNNDDGYSSSLGAAKENATRSEESSSKPSSQILQEGVGSQASVR